MIRSSKLTRLHFSRAFLLRGYTVIKPLRVKVKVKVSVIDIFASVASCHRHRHRHRQVENGPAFFAGFNPVGHIMIAVAHTGGYAVMQVKHRGDLNLKLILVYIFNLFRTAFSMYCNFWHIFRKSVKVA